MWPFRSRSSHGQGHLKITDILRSKSFWNQMVMCFDFYPKVGSWLSSECLSLLVFYICLFVVFFLVMNLVMCLDYYRNGIFYRTLSELTSVPDDIPAEAREVYLYENSIEQLEKNTFSHLSKCEKLDLDNNKIFIIEVGAFNRLRSLTRLELHSNNLTIVKSNMFLGLPQCEELDLYGNTISVIENGSFNALGNLKKLWLDNNKLSELRSDMFLGLSSLQKLWLERNRLTTLNSDVLESLPRPLFLSLGNSYDNFSDNSFRCDAKLCWLKWEEIDGSIKWNTYDGREYKPECSDGTNWDTLNCFVTGKT